MQTHRLVETIHSEDGTSPLGVMLANLTFYHNSAVALTEKLMLVADLLTPEKIAEGGEDMLELMKLIKKVTEFRMQAQTCAVDAAPYVHPKLASIEFTGNPDKPIEHVHKLMSPKEAAQAYLQSLDAVAVPR